MDFPFKPGDRVQSALQPNHRGTVAYADRTIVRVTWDDGSMTLPLRHTVIKHVSVVDQLASVARRSEHD